MILGLMQPYIFPYLGYYQLVNSVDRFVFYDDVTYIKGGYINRNLIKVNNKKQRFTVPLIGASSNVMICAVLCSDKLRKLLTTIEQAYCKAPYFNDIYPLIKETLLSEERRLSVVAAKSIELVFKYLEIEKELYFSSDLAYDRTLSATDKIIDICKIMNCNKYINSYGGINLYDQSYFKDNSICLNFIRKNEMHSYQNNTDSEFIDNLSMIDILMWNSKEQVCEMLLNYELI